MSKLIVVCGQPGSGKTMIAKALSKKLNIPCIHKDSLKENLYDISLGHTMEDSQRLGKWSVQLLLSLAEEQIQNGVDIMIESPFNYPDEPKLFVQWKEKYKLDVYVIICQIDGDTRKARYTERAKTNRHPSHHDAERLTSMWGDSFDWSSEYVDYAAMTEKKIFITTDAPMQTLLEHVMQNMEA